MVRQNQERSVLVVICKILSSFFVVGGTLENESIIKTIKVVRIEAKGPNWSLDKGLSKRQVSFARKLAMYHRRMRQGTEKSLNRVVNC